jgi:thymidylate synthase
MHSLNVGTNAIVSGNWDTIYARYITEILRHGDVFEGRNGETKALFGCSVTVDLKAGFPLTRLRKMPVKNLFREFLFDVGFDTNVAALGPAQHFWSFLADASGELGASAYCRSWRQWPGSRAGVEVPNEQLHKDPVDQIRIAISKLRSTPNTRHGTIITHNPTAIDPACPPCHIGIQLMPRPDGSLDMMVPARSNDMIVGFPLDIARYAIMTHVIAKAVGMKPGRLFMPSANSHVYSNCYNIAEKLIGRESRPECQLTIDDSWDHEDENPLEFLMLDHFNVVSYDPHEAIKISVN